MVTAGMVNSLLAFVGQVGRQFVPEQAVCQMPGCSSIHQIQSYRRDSTVNFCPTFWRDRFRGGALVQKISGIC
jgi:hypothetical protein